MNARQRYLISEERKKIVHNLTVMKTAKYRCVTAIAKSLILNAPYLRNGDSFDIQAKSLGAGVWEISIKE